MVIKKKNSSTRNSYNINSPNESPLNSRKSSMELHDELSKSNSMRTILEYLKPNTFQKVIILILLISLIISLFGKKFENTKKKQGKKQKYRHYKFKQLNTYTGPIQEIKYPNGEIYRGQMKLGKKHGWGALQRENKEKYEGFFIADKYEGEGVYTYKDESKYIGQWKKGLYHGEGEIKYQNYNVANPNSHYTWIYSKWIYGKTKKSIMLSEYEFYHGEMKGEKIHGFGIYINKRGRHKYVYKGHHWNGLKHGFGEERILVSEKIAIYKGTWKMNNKTGFGELITYINFPNKWFSFMGNFENNQAHGHGIQIHSNGTRKTGYFTNGFPDGYIFEETLVKSLYRGFFKEGQRSGQALYKDQYNQLVFSNWSNKTKNSFTLAKNTDGSGYLGLMNTKDSRFHGQGTFYFNKDKTGIEYIRTNWEDGNTSKMVHISLNEKRGEKYVGEYKNQMRHGIGTYYVFEGFYIESRWQNGKAFGASQIVYKNVLKFKGFIYKNMFYSLWNSDLGTMELGWNCSMFGNCQ